MKDRSLVQEVLEAAQLLFHPGTVIEVRVPSAGQHRTVSGYFSDLEKLAEAVYTLEHTRPAYPGIYWTLNPVRPDMLARADQRLIRFAKYTTSDTDVVRRCWLPIDIDPVRPAGISSTDIEHKGAHDLAARVQAELSVEGWPEPIYADSGNGAHLLYAVDLPNDEQSAEMLQRCLGALAARFNTSQEPLQEVDLTVFTAARIFKIYGTTARKGDSTEIRPHRVSRILSVPALIAQVHPDLLTALAAKAPESKKRSAQRQLPAASNVREIRSAGGRSNFNLRDFLDRHGVQYRSPVPYDGGFKFTLEACPFDPSHKGKDAAVFERSDGYGFKCFHNTCANRDWQEFRELFEPDAYTRRHSAGGRSSTLHPADRGEEPPGDLRRGVDDAELPLQADDVKAGVQAAIDAGNFDDAIVLIPEISKLSALEVLKIKAALTEKFGRKFRASDFEKALREERRRAMAGLPREGTSLPTIFTGNRPMRDVVRDSLAALGMANDPPFLFVRSGQMVFVELDERERPSIIAVEKAHLRGRLDRAANYLRRGEQGVIAVPPPIEIVEDILALPSAKWALPPLEFVVEVPTLRQDGTILSEPGYDPLSRMLYCPPPNFKMDAIPDRIEADDLDAAVALVDEAIGDFPYADHKDENGVVSADNPNRANLFGLLLTPIVRPAIAGCVPLALIDAPQAGTGKSLLADLFSVITTGRNAAMMPYPRNEEEMQKSIGSTLLAGRALVCFDNIEGILQSPTLALVITAREYEARILGVSQNMLAQNRATWLATGNNIKPSGDMPRRCYHIRLDAKKSRPYQGRKFKHEDLLGWARQSRPQLLRSLLVIARSWYQRKDKPQLSNPWGSFEEWHRAIGGILRSAGVGGFLGNLETFLSEADDNAVQWELFLSELHEAYPDQWFKVSVPLQALRAATALSPAAFTIPDSLADVDRRKEGSLERALGKSFAKRIGTRFGENEVYVDRRIDKHTKQAEWRIFRNAPEVVESTAAVLEKKGWE